MSLLFDRRYRLRFGQPNGDKREVNNLRIVFDVERSSDSGANTGTIQVWNLSDKSISELQRPGCNVTLEAGYGTEIGMIFSGNDLKLLVRRALPNVIVEIRAQDGGEQLRTQVVNASFEPGTILRNVVESLIGAFKDIVKNPQDLLSLESLTLPKGFNATGKVKQLLDEMLGSRGFQWSVQDNEIRIVADDSLADTGAAIKLTAETGLVGSPTRTEDGANVLALLNARIRPYRELRIESSLASVTGSYKVDKVRHRGDSWGRDWYTMAECRAR